MSGTRNEPKIEAYIGASGSGKGVSITRRLAELKPPRLLIWDPRDEYGKAAKRFTSLPALIEAVAEAGPGPFKARYVAGDSVKLETAFGMVCRLAFTAGDLVFLAEELSDVTSASQAPPEWRKCITQGRHRAMHILAAAQRPALIDKTLLGNCTYIRCFTLRYSDDRRAMAKAMDLPESQITALLTTKDAKGVRINYAEKDFREGFSRTGRINLTF